MQDLVPRAGTEGNPPLRPENNNLPDPIFDADGRAMITYASTFAETKQFLGPKASNAYAANFLNRALDGVVTVTNRYVDWSQSPVGHISLERLGFDTTEWGYLNKIKELQSPKRGSIDNANKTTREMVRKGRG